MRVEARPRLGAKPSRDRPAGHRVAVSEGALDRGIGEPMRHQPPRAGPSHREVRRREPRDELGGSGQRVEVVEEPGLVEALPPAHPLDQRQHAEQRGRDRGPQPRGGTPPRRHRRRPRTCGSPPRARGRPGGTPGTAPRRRRTAAPAGASAGRASPPPTRRSRPACCAGPGRSAADRAPAASRAASSAPARPAETPRARRPRAREPGTPARASAEAPPKATPPTPGRRFGSAEHLLWCARVAW